MENTCACDALRKPSRSYYSSKKQEEEELTRNNETALRVGRDVVSSFQSATCLRACLGDLTLLGDSSLR